MESENVPTEAKKVRNPWKIGALTGLTILLVIILGVGTYWKVHNSQTAKLERRKILVRQRLTEMLDTKTISQTFQYRDQADKSKVITFNLSSNFSNPRKPETQGTIKVSYIEKKVEKIQTAEFITKKADDGGDDIYLRIIEGRELTNAPEGWYYADAFRTLRTVPGFKNFWDFSYDKLNQVQGYVVIGSLRDTPEKAKIAEEIARDETYKLDECSESKDEIKCPGELSSRGLQTIDRNVAISEALSSTNFGIPVNSNVPISITVNKNTSGVSKFEISGDPHNNPLVVTYSNYNKGFILSLPKNYQKLPSTR